MAKMYLIDEDLANAILEYLSHKPYREVYGFMSPLQNLILAEPSLIEYPTTEDFVSPPHQETAEPV